jgi:hypothetical protein
MPIETAAAMPICPEPGFAAEETFGYLEEFIVMVGVAARFLSEVAIRGV